jgi:hypothetical protein
MMGASYAETCDVRITGRHECFWNVNFNTTTKFHAGTARNVSANLQQLLQQNAAAGILSLKLIFFQNFTATNFIRQLT